MIFGKLIGGLLGFSSAGLFGAIVGLFIGHYFDKAFSGAMSFNYGADRAKLQRLFFETTFTVMGHLAKADGHISKEEITQAESLMGRLGLSTEHRQEAIILFKQGSRPDFQLEPVILNFVNEGGRQHNLPILLLEFLFSIAMADGEMHAAEQQVLSRCANFLGISSRNFERLISMLMAQQSFQSGHYQQGGFQQQSSASNLNNAYQALGVSSTDSDRDIKKAYRKLISQHHPDKLIAQGVPEDMLKLATEKSQEIQVAYDLIKEQRKKS